ncbi:MAG: hypothetical protein IKX65_06165 [Prevotella sp.]|nr:hypothetical protein [Prevotella sp.]
MNIKLHTPKSLKMGSGMASMKQIPMLGTLYSHVGNLFVKPDEQSETSLGFAMARKGRMKSNVLSCSGESVICQK